MSTKNDMEKRSVYLSPEDLEAIEAERDAREREDGERPSWNGTMRVILRRGYTNKRKKTR